MNEYNNMGGKPLEEWCSIPGIPRYMIEGLYNYVEHGIGPGSFLTAVICNDLKRAVYCADNSNRACLVEWVEVMTWCVPGGCQGSSQLMGAWMDKKREEKDASKV